MPKRAAAIGLDLEDLIRAAAEAGELTHLSVVPVAGTGPKNISWSASYSPGSKFGTGLAVNVDPVQALVNALTDTRLGALTRKVAGKAAAKPAPVASEPVDDSDFI